MITSEDFLIKPNSKVNLRKIEADNTNDNITKIEANEELKKIHPELSNLQYKLHADRRHCLLIILQAMDAGGKDSSIRQVMRGFNPQGCKVKSFRVPTHEELEHDYLWRIHKNIPSRGEIGIFNRSHYEDVLVVRVHNLVPKSIWSKRYDQINEFERMLSENGTTILKFYLHISRDEQKKRFQKRIQNPNKHWKIDEADFEERKHWAAYVRAYEQVLEKCSTKWAPWYIIPSNQKWFRNLVLATIISKTLEDMKLRFPKPKLDIKKLKFS